MPWKVEFTREASAEISRLAKEQRIPQTEVLRRALALTDFLHEEGVVPGGKKDLQIRDANTDELVQTIKF
ncbi:MAG: hypothetical protein NTZ49_00395 [Candidatus Parcubacteria bacterium]|nr:hypothetical protein [Candidatus Parcubacteria bacterium]